MQTSKSSRNSRRNETEWYILAEYSLSGGMVDKDLGDDLYGSPLFQTILELGVSLDCLNDIRRTLCDFTTKANGQRNQARFTLPVYLRLFCQKRITVDENTAGDSEDYAKDQAINLTHLSRHARAKINGGWGYYLIERSEGSTPVSSDKPNNCIDLYLYKEGD